MPVGVSAGFCWFKPTKLFGRSLKDLNVDVQNSASFIANESANDGNGHGTHVAGIIASTGQTTGIQGVAAGASVVAVKVCFDQPPGPGQDQCPANSIINGVNYISIQAQPDDIVNMSIWGPINEDIEQSITDAADAGIRFTLIAGNAGADANNFSPGRIVHNNTWTMSAMDNTDTFAFFSNFGNPPIDYAGPGVDILSLWRNGGTETESGTSMAAPHVAGILLATGDEPLTDGFVSNDPDGDPDPVATATITLSAPFIFASVNSDHPHLSWSAVNDAEEYKIYRRVEQGSWQWIGTVSTTSFTDWTQSSPHLSVIFSPHQNWDNTLGYRVRSTSSQTGYEDSPNSNTVYFSTDGSCNPCP